MSSDGEESTSPVLPKDSDRGSSVSSELQDEYEELLRYAVVTPKHETLTSSHMQRLGTLHLSADSQSSQRKNDTKSQRPAAEEMGGRSCSRVSMLSGASSNQLQTTSKRSSSPDPVESAVKEMFVSEQNISRMENILDMWSNNLKSNVLMELRKWKLTFIEQHKQEKRKEEERFAAQTAGLKTEIESIKGLLHTYETSNQRKDEVIMNLSRVLNKQKDKLEKMRAFTHWRLQHAAAKEEAHAAQIAQQHYNLQLKKKVWLGWHSLIQKHWKVKVEQACRAKAEEVCTRLSAEYEAKLAEHYEAIEKAHAEIQRLQQERERYEESMKKAFMRGVCALNIEALSMFHTTEGPPEQPPVHNQHDRQDEAGSATLVQLETYPVSSTGFSPVHFDRPDPPSHSEAEEILNGRIITASQQKSSKTVTARITARPDVSKPARSNLQVMGVAPPMSSVIVERHHPVTQLTVGQATAAKFPRSSQQGHSSTGGRRTHTTTCHVHSIKVVD
ncbi:Centrosomal protein POC5 Protein of centriole 5 [Channa argus]|uniref:Centrosomal protein POC5 n=1 Tax=Channa argus TaxID=215402 RepID=A0A6G1Q080_CHAAH|nr:Centrosomal protein POC5 Protein of centriole 5 [Channa argus]